ncbi:MAG: PQQ-binding-like beta-propeller repeat protein [Melioribacteraceae bacterium]|nr:MAG: PQQ-binding-like beta-propeller repeat protein [Melioribacteraceae bacterium]
MNKFILYFSLTLVLLAQTQNPIDWPSLADSPWPMIKGDPQGTGRSKYVGPSTANIMWTKDMPRGIVHGPIIGYEDILYFGTAGISPDSNYFFALNPDGTERWVFRTEKGYPNYGAAIIDKDSTIYFPSNNSHIYAVDKNGRQKWKTGSLAIGLKSILNISKEGDLYVSTYLDSMLIIDTEDGRIKYKKYIGENLNANQFAFSVEGDKLFYVRAIRGSGDNSFVGCMDLEGNIIWEKEARYSSEGMPIVDNENNIYIIGADSSRVIISFLGASGEKRWVYKYQKFTRYHTPAIDKYGNIIYADWVVLDGKTYTSINSLNNDGDLNWSYVIDHDTWYNTDVEGQITVDAEGKIYFGATREGYFYCLSKDGELLWKLYLEGNDFDSSPAIGSDGTLYIGSHGSSTAQGQQRTLIAIKDDPNSVIDEEIPTEFKLEQNYPNPFNPSTTIKFTIPNVGDEYIRPQQTSLIVYDILGREIKTLINEIKVPGTYEVEFDASKLPSGIFFYRLQSGDFTQTKKMMVIK